ncbi:CehA/McbA family metallohydrolase domain-containing protein [Stieleria varia]|nr:hypothetical protein [Stieleria varia]
MKSAGRPWFSLVAKAWSGVACRCGVVCLVATTWVSSACGANGTLTFTADDKATGASTITRMELWRGTPTGKTTPVRRTVPAGIGVVLDRSVELTMPDGPYHFRLIRGPEYRIVTGTFTLEPTSLDEKNVQLPRMVDMLSEGWTSGDCMVVASENSLPLRMASEDLHVASVMGHQDAKPIPYRDADYDIGGEPKWIREDVSHHDGLAFYGLGPETWNSISAADTISTRRLVIASERSNEENTIQIGVENPFAWELPVWLASSRINGFFLMGDWLRLDRKILKVAEGRGPQNVGFGDGQQLGRYAEEIYRNILDAGIRMPPLAGGGSASNGTPVGYNRLYVTLPSDAPSDHDVSDPLAVTDAQQWWSGVWRGNSVATNGPMLRPKLAGKLPGHVFTGSAGTTLQLQPELELAVRDPVEYLEVIHNGRVHYSARLKEFAEAGGRIPMIETDQSGWVFIRVVTLHEDHYRAAVSAPWYVEINGRPRVSKRSVEFFQKWLADYEAKLVALPPERLAEHAPFIRAARTFWQAKAEVAVE